MNIQQTNIKRERLLNALTELIPAERQELATAEKIINSGTKKEKRALLKDTITNFNEIFKVYKFCENSETFKNFCCTDELVTSKNKNKTINDELSPLRKWANILSLLGYPGITLDSLDRNQKVTISDQYFGAYFLSEYFKFKRGEKRMDPEVASLCLDLACEKGLFAALVERCEENRKKIKNMRLTDAARKEALSQIILDTDQLENLYWTVGSLHSALVLLDVGNIIANEKDNKTASQAHALQAEAALKFLRGRELATFKGLSKDKKIIKDICGEKGLLSFDIDNWDTAQNFYLDHVNYELLPHNKLILSAKKYIRDQVAPSRENRIF